VKVSLNLLQGRCWKHLYNSSFSFNSGKHSLPFSFATRLDSSVDQFNPTLCVVSSPRYTPGQYLNNCQDGSVCRINILDKILVTEGYFKRFRSCGIEKRKRDNPGLAVDLLVRPILRSRMIASGKSLSEK
jgi:hypothetical protein